MHITFNKTAKLFVVSLVLFVALVAAYAFVFLQIKKNTSRSADANIKIEELSGKDIRIESARTTLKKESVTIEKITRSFIKEGNIVDFTRTIEALGPMTGTTLSIESLDPAVVDRNVPVLNFRLKAEGAFKDVVELVALLENFPGRFDWSTVRFVNVSGGTAGVEGKAPVKPVEARWVVEVSLTALNFVKE